MKNNLSEALKDALEEKDCIVRYKSYLKNRYPRCKYCNNYLFLDDIDYKFDGNQDEYWTCDSCASSMHVKVRYSKVYGILWFKGDK